MRSFIVNVNGNSYEVEVEEVNTRVRSRPVNQDSAQRQESTAKKPVESSISQKEVKKAPEKVVEQAPKVEEVKSEPVVSEGQEIIESPMPGNIWKILVSEGDTVKSGDVLLILEAMKMENEIVSPIDGKVVSISTSEGSPVNTGDTLAIVE